jgi:hypothetical protein
MEMDSPIQGYRGVPLVSLEEAVQPLLSLVPEIEQMVQTVQQNCDQPANMLSEDESASIKLYTLPKRPLQSSFSSILNKTLQSQNQNRERLAPWFLYLRLFNSALSKLPPSSCHVFFRQMQIPRNSIYRKGKTFIWWDFVSCRSSIEPLEHLIDDNETKVIFIIECTSAKDITKHSYTPNEHDIILPQGKQFDVISSWNSTDKLKFIQIREAVPRAPLISIRHPSSTSIPHRPTECPISNHCERIDPLQFIDGCAQNSKIDLFRFKLVDNQMNTVVQKAIINKQCKILILTENQITSVGATIIADALKNNRTLEFLSLSYNPLHDQGIQTLTGILSSNNCCLQKLSLHSIGLTCEGAGHIAKMLETNKTLTWLHLGGNNLTDEGVNELSTALTNKNTTLEVLALSNDKSITDSSIESLVTMLLNNKTLNTLWMNDCKLTEEGTKRLRGTIKLNKYFFILTTEKTKMQRLIP